MLLIERDNGAKGCKTVRGCRFMDDDGPLNPLCMVGHGNVAYSIPGYCMMFDVSLDTVEMYIWIVYTIQYYTYLTLYYFTCFYW